MKVEHLPDDLLIDYKVDNDKNKKYIHRERKIKDSFSLEDLIDEETLNKLRLRGMEWTHIIGKKMKNF